MKQYSLYLWKLNVPETIIFVLVMVYLLLFGSCKIYCPEIVPVSEKDSSYTETVWNTVTLRDIIQDSAAIKLWLACRDGKVILVDKDVTQGNSIKIKDTLVGNYLITKCNIDSNEVVKSFLIAHPIIHTIKEKTNNIILPPTNILTSWQWFQIWSGRILGLIVLGFVIFKLIKK